MYIIFFLIWVIFNGQFTLEIAAFGAAIAGIMYWFICRFFNYDPKTDLFLGKRLSLLPGMRLNLQWCVLKRI